MTSGSISHKRADTKHLPRVVLREDMHVCILSHTKYCKVMLILRHQHTAFQTLSYEMQGFENYQVLLKAIKSLMIFRQGV